MDTVFYNRPLKFIHLAKLKFYSLWEKKKKTYFHLLQLLEMTFLHSVSVNLTILNILYKGNYAVFVIL